MILAELTGTVDVVDDGSPYVLGDVEIIDDGTFWFELTVDNRAAVAFAERFQQLGVGIRINGIPIADAEIGDVLTITESADSYGDRLTFQLIGARFGPFARELLRSKALVEVWLVTGNTASEFRKKVFTGHVFSFSFSDTNTADIECLDAAGLYAQRRAKTWTLAPNSGRTRLSIGLELLAFCSIPAGFVDVGPNAGGVVNKALAPGDQPVLDYIRDLWGIAGAEIGFEDGKLCARRYIAGTPPVMELNAGNLLTAFTLSSADTLQPNVLGVVSTSFSQGDTDWRAAPPDKVTIVGPYARRGVGATVPIVSVISDVTTSVAYRGTLDVRTEVIEWGWFSPAGVEFEWTDGTTHEDPYEVFQLISHVVESKSLDSELRVIGKRTEISRPLPDELVTITYQIAADGTIASETELREFFDDRPSLSTTIRYRVINEDRYSVTETSISGDGATPRQTTSTLSGAPPYPERVEPETSSQKIGAIVEDLARISLAGEQIESITQNEFIETQEDADVYAHILARRASAITLRCEVPIESLAHKFRHVRVNLPGSSIDGLSFYVREVTRDAATYRQGIVAEYYAPEFN